VTASQHMVQANGLRFRTMVDGPAGGEMVILLHGFPEGAESWSRQVDALAKAGALAVAPDMRGYGLSDAPDRVEDYRMNELVEDVAGIIKAFGRTSAHVAGHDWGAAVAWYFASIHPDMTKTLTVLSVGHPAALADATAQDKTSKNDHGTSLSSCLKARPRVCCQRKTTAGCVRCWEARYLPPWSTTSSALCHDPVV